MKVIYEPKGKAQEYSPLAVNGKKGCGHGCGYCYAPKAMFIPLAEFNNPVEREGFLEALEIDAAFMEKNGDSREVFLSFGCDPYQPLDVETKTTRETLKILIRHGIRIIILTKGGHRSARDFDILLGHKDKVKYGTTLTVCHGKEPVWEPHAALTMERIGTLTLAKTLGLRTWVSLEPVIFPEDTLRLIADTHEMVDEYRIGKFNYVNSLKKEGRIPADYQEPTDEELRTFCSNARDLLERMHKSYIFKDSLLPYIEKIPGKCPKCGTPTFKANVDDTWQEFCQNNDCWWKAPTSDNLIKSGG